MVTGPDYSMAAPSDGDLRRLAALLDDGTLRVHVHDTFEVERATDALQALTERVRGNSRSAFAERTPSHRFGCEKTKTRWHGPVPQMSRAERCD